MFSVNFGGFTETFSEVKRCITEHPGRFHEFSEPFHEVSENFQGVSEEY